MQSSYHRLSQVTGLMLLAFVASSAVQAATFTVTNTNDSGAGSLRQAIDDANGTFGADRIEFNIAGAGVHTIQTATDLPDIFDNVVIDGSTQPGFAGTPLIEIGGAFGPRTVGLIVTSGVDATEIRNLTINNCTDANIRVDGCNNTIIAGCWLGINSAGTATSGTPAANILLRFSSNNCQIGQVGANNANVIGGGTIGLNIRACDNTTVVNSTFGTRTGAENLGFSSHGIRIGSDGESNPVGSIIGSAAGPNLIVNCGGAGVAVENGIAPADSNQIQYNRIFNTTSPAIDLAPNDTLDGNTINDDGDADTGANGLQNFPVIESAALEGTNLRVRGWVRAGDEIQFYESSTAAGAFGNANTLLSTVTEGGGSDLDATSTAYSGAINGLNQGADNSPNRFEFLFGPVALAAGDRVAAIATSVGGNRQTSEVGGNATVLGPAAALRWVQHPSDAVAGASIAPAMTVEVVDAANQRVTTDNTTQITLSINNNPGGSTLSGTATQTVVNGLATFGNISLDKVGTGYTLNAASTGLTTVVSNPFDITAGAAARLAFGQQPSDTVAGTTITPAVTVRVEDSNGNLVNVDGASITLAIGNNPGGGTLSGTVTTTTTAGIASYNTLSIDRAGVGYTLTAASTGLTGATSAAFNITFGAAAWLAFVQGPTDTVAGQPITPAVTVRIEDSFGNLVVVDGTPVTLAIVNNPSAGTLSGTATQNSSGGIATFNDLSIDRVGVGYTLGASAPGISGDTSVAFNITAGPAARLVFVQQPTNTVAGVAVAPAVTVRIEDAQGNAVTADGTAITLSIDTNPAAGTLSGTATQNSVAGLSTYGDLSIDKAGTGYTLRATAIGLADAISNPFNITAAAANRLAFLQQPTDTAAGVSINPAVTVRIEDAFGNLVSTTGTVITLAIGTNPSGGTLSGTAAQNTVNGISTYADLSIDLVGTGYTLSASSPGLTGATSNPFNIIAGPAARLAFVQQPSDTVAGASISPSVTVRIEDSFGNQVLTTGTAITLAIGTNPGGGTLSGTAVQNSVLGLSTYGDLSIDKVGAGYTLTASATGLTGATSNPFNITAAPAARLVFVQQPTDALAGVAIAPPVTVRIEDAFGNVIAANGTAITLSIDTNPAGGTLSGTLTQNTVDGVSTYNDLNINVAGNGYTLRANAVGLADAISNPFNILAGTANRLAFVQQPTDTLAASAITPSVSVRIVDSLGNLVVVDGTPITLAIENNPSGGTLSGTLTQNTVGGVATFPALSIDLVGNGYTLRASAGGLVPAVSDPFNILAGPPNALRFVQQPTDALVNATIAPAVTVRLFDAGGNALTTDGVAITLAIGSNPSGGTPAGTLTQNSVAGLATFADLSIDTVGTGYTLVASSTGLTGATSTAFNILALPASRLVFVQQPTDTVVNTSITPSVSVRLENSVGELVATSGVAITLAIGTNPASGTLFGTVTQNTVNGVATFPGLSIDQVGNGYTLTAASTGLTGAVSNTFNILPLRLSFGEQPTDTYVNATISPAVTVRLEDPNGKLLALDGQSITLAIGTNPAGGTLAGTLTQTTTAGVATFGNLSIDAIGNGYTLVASHATATSATSSTFNILPPPVGTATLTASPESVRADGATASTLIITLRDGFGQPMTSVPASRLSLTADPTNGLTLNQATAATDANGRTTGSTTRTVPGTVTFTLFIDGANSGVTAQVNFLPGASLTVDTDVYFIGFPITQGTGSPKETLGTDLAWREVRWDEASTQYVPYSDVTDAANPAFFFPRGRGHYVRWNFARTLQFNGEALNTEVVVPLTRGWTTLGNPFTAIMQWNLSQLTIRETATGTVLGTLADRSLWDTVRPYCWRYNRTTRLHELVFPDLGTADTLQVYDGFWMFALADGLEVVLSPSTAFGRSSREQDTPTPGSWATVILASDGSEQSQVVVGVDGQLTRAMPIEAAPGPQDGGLDLKLVSATGRYAGELGRPSNRQEWELAATSRAGGPVTLSWPSLGRSLPPGTLLTLTDRQSGERTALNGSGSYSYNAVPGQERRLLLTAEPFGNQRSTITDLHSSTSRAAGSSFTMTLSGPATVTVNIRGLGGRLVRTLRQDVTAAGTVAIDWDGRDDHGRAVPAGTYNVEAVAEGPLGLSHRVVRTVTVQ